MENMKKIFALIFLPFIALVGCSDGVPHVEDPHHPVDASGKPIKGADFVQKYCAGKSNNETCSKVATAVSKDSTRKGVPKGW